MRVLFLNPVGGLGGSERSLLDVMASLGASAPHLEMGLLTGGEGPLLEEAAALGVDVMSLPFPARLSVLGDSGAAGSAQRLARLGFKAALASKDVALYLGRMRTLVRRFAPSVVHSNGAKMHVLTAALGHRSNRIVWHVRDFIGERPVMASALRLASPRAALAIANSKAVGADLRNQLPGLPVSVIYNAIDTDVFCPSDARACLDTLCGMAPPAGATARVGIVATYARWKGHEVFLKAAKQVRDRRCAPVRFYVIGGPLYQTAGSQYAALELRTMVRELGIEDCVGFVPFQRKPEEVYRALDIVVHASTRPEPFGRTIVEAMACGRAVIVAGTGGALELFSDGVDAVRVRPTDPSALATEIGRLVNEPAVRARLGLEARATATRRFSRHRLGGEVLAAYSTLTYRLGASVMA